MKKLFEDVLEELGRKTNVVTNEVEGSPEYCWEEGYGAGVLHSIGKLKLLRHAVNLKMVEVMQKCFLDGASYAPTCDGDFQHYLDQHYPELAEVEARNAKIVRLEKLRAEVAELEKELDG